MGEVSIRGEHKADWVTISHDEYESMKSTIRVLSDSELLRQIQKSRENFKKGKFKKLSDLIRLG
jgi:PHD/YefM family antitoxin component YafN of YafNO toxin-antitoxin module